MALLPALFALLLAGDFPSPHVRATVWVRAGDRGNGTGWVVDADRRWVVTAGHVVGDRESVEVYFLDRWLNHPAIDRRHYVANRSDLQRRGLTATGRVVLRHDKSDLVLLALDRLPPGVPTLPLAVRPARPGEACRSVGHRHDADLMWNLTVGHVRQVGRLPDGYFSAGHRVGAGVPLLLLQSPIEAGESGSAVLNDDGQVVGIVSAVANQTPGLAIGIDVSEIRGLLADASKKVTPTLPAAARKTRPDADALSRATVWVRPQSTSGRSAGVLIDRERKLVLTSAMAVGTESVVDIVAPRWDSGHLVPEIEAYADRLGLRLSGHCISGIVVARDTARDLALIELNAVPDDLIPLSVAKSGPRMGDRIASMGHPTGIDLLWLYAGGTVRSVGMVELARDGAGDRPKVQASLLQLPHQGSASGAPVVSEAGELLGILAGREAARQDLAYAATPEEIRSFLDAARPLSQPQSGTEWVRRGRFVLRLGRLEAASATFLAATAREPENTDALAGHASSLVVAGHAADAIRIAESAVKHKISAAALAELAEVFLLAGQSDRAAELVDRAFKSDPRCAAAFVVRARLRSGRGSNEDVAEALFIDPNCASAYRVRAGLRDRTTLDGLREAIADLSRVLELNPVDTEGLRERAGLFAAVMEPKKAVADWSRLTELRPFEADHWVGLARARFAANDREGAAEALGSVLRVEPGRTSRVFRVVRELGRELEEDNATDHRRVADWYSMALTRLASWLPQ